MLILTLTLNASSFSSAESHKDAKTIIIDKLVELENYVSTELPADTDTFDVTTQQAAEGKKRALLNKIKAVINQISHGWPEVREGAINKLENDLINTIRKWIKSDDYEDALLRRIKAILDLLRGIPVAAFSFTPETPRVGETVTFNASESYDLNGYIVDYLWDFGDGNNGTGKIATHVYLTEGTFTVTLTVVDNEGFSDTAQAEVTVLPAPIHNVAVTAVIPSPTEVYVGETVSINVTVENYGEYTEDVAVYAYADIEATVIGDEIILGPVQIYSLERSLTSTVTFTWNTTGLAEGTYTISGEAFIEADDHPEDNRLIDGTVNIMSIPIAVHDIAIWIITVSPTEAYVGDPIRINVILANEGTEPETSGLYIYADVNTTVIGDEIVIAIITNVSLDPGATTTLIVTWDTAGVTEGTYTISAHVPPVPDEIDTADNTFIDGSVVIQPKMHDIAVTKVKPFPTTVLVGETVTINVTVKNEGDYYETFNVVIYADVDVTVIGDEVIIGTMVDIPLDLETSKTLTFTWNTTDVAEGTYIISAEAIVKVDDDPSDNIFVDDMVIVSPVLKHNVAVADITVSPTEVYVGDPVYIEVTVTNEGDYSEIFNVTVYADPDNTVIGDEIVIFTFISISLEAGAATIQSCTWDTIDVKEGTYTISAEAVISIDDYPDDNLLVDGVVTVLNRPPVAIFTESAETVHTGEIIYFNASQSYDLDGHIVSYFWDFGDGTTGTGVIVEHSYADDGLYIVKLTVTDDDGATASTTAAKAVANRPPTASFTENATTLYRGEVIRFNATESFDPDGYIASYLWSFGDGTNATGVIVDHVYIDDGNYTVTLTVTDDDGALAVVTATKFVLNRPPIASFTENATIVKTGEVILFDASASYDPDGTIVSYTWNFGDGTIASGITVTHSYVDDGTYTVTLNVTDNDGATTSLTATKTVLNRPPIASFTESALTVYAGEVIRFNASASYDPDGTIVSYTWNFGDGNITTTTSPIINHTYTTPGTYNVTLTVTDDDGQTDDEVKTFTVQAAPWPLWLILIIILLILAAIAVAVYLWRKRRRRKQGIASSRVQNYKLTILLCF
jgi:PKD repeat protein